MSSTIIIQYTHRPNMTELGMGNTHETYMLVDAKTDLSKVFPPNESVLVVDSLNGKSYHLKSSKGSEFRVNQMGSIYRDYSVMPGDEIIITHFATEDSVQNLLSVHNYNRIGISVNANGSEIVNIERLEKYAMGSGSYSFLLNDGREVSIAFLESKKKRSDSPSETDYYSVKINNAILANGKYYINLNDAITLEQCPVKSEYNRVVLEDNPSSNPTVVAIRNRQVIYYGAPGTGKSFEINRLTKDKEVIRTTFHPDSDYSTFVGAYKPTSIEIPIRDVTGKVIVENGKQVTENRIVYEFVEQAFLQAYTKAWKEYAEASDGEKAKEQYLVIEEINRGNCAQIFGDLFQLLDRNKYGFSDYPITADNDMRKQLAKAFTGLTIADAERINNIYKKDVIKKVMCGEILLLPDNLYIWATMNTSDQSLFPIDSAFKRRWDWKYIPISEGRNETGQRLGYKIEANDNHYDWWNFLDKINHEIDDQTKSEDKKLGYFFCKADNDGIISAETFVSKVVFYLWNDVFKDQAFASDIFHNGDEELTFAKFYTTDAMGKAVVKEDVVDSFLKNLGVTIVGTNETIEIDEIESVPDFSKSKTTLKEIIFPDGTIIDAGKGIFDAYMLAIEKIGVEKVCSVSDRLKYRRRGHPLISKEKYAELESDYGYSYYTMGNYYFLRGANTYTYVRILEDLNEMLQVGMTIHN